MLQLLFEHTPQKKQQPKLVEITKEERAENSEYQQVLEIQELRKEYAAQQRKVKQLKEEFKRVLDKVQLVKSSFGKPKLILNITPEVLEILKQQYN